MFSVSQLHTVLRSISLAQCFWHQRCFCFWHVMHHVHVLCRSISTLFDHAFYKSKSRAYVEVLLHGHVSTDQTATNFTGNRYWKWFERFFSQIVEVLLKYTPSIQRLVLSMKIYGLFFSIILYWLVPPWLPTKLRCVSSNYNAKWLFWAFLESTTHY